MPAPNARLTAEVSGMRDGMREKEVRWYPAAATGKNSKQNSPRRLVGVLATPNVAHHKPPSWRQNCSNLLPACQVRLVPRADHLALRQGIIIRDGCLGAYRVGIINYLNNSSSFDAQARVRRSVVDESPTQPSPTQPRAQSPPSPWTSSSQLSLPLSPRVRLSRTRSATRLT